MSYHNEYFNYLKKRSFVGGLYRKFYLYPVLVRNLEGKTLDIGCGIGDFINFRPQTTGVDINHHAVKYCNSIGLDAFLMRDNVLPFPDHSFNSIILDNVLEHIENPVPIINEISRVLNSDNMLLVGVPGKLGWNSDSDHKIFYDENLLTKLFIEHGYKALKLFHTPFFKSSFLSNHIKQYCIYCLFTLQK